MIEDEFISDKGINAELEKLVTYNALKFQPSDKFNSRNIIKSLRHAMELENDEKTKSILALMLGLYLVRDQTKDELNEVFKRTAMLSRHGLAVSGDIERIYMIANQLIDALAPLIQNESDYDELKSKIDKLDTFRKEAEPILLSLQEIIDKRTREIYKEKEDLK